MEETLKIKMTPKYTKGEEIFNMVSHIVGGVAGIAALILCIVFSVIRNNPYGLASGMAFGMSMILLYTISSIYHGLRPGKAKSVFRILDHCSIFILIAGSYTPFALCTLRQYDSITGWTIFGVIWLIAVLGVVFNAINLDKYKNISVILYVLMGWCIVFKINLLPMLLGVQGFVLLLLGGIIYTVGAILYVIGKKRKYIHSVFHIFVFLGNILHFLCILLYVI
ncbi:hemolysin-III related [compost metagenome]